MQEVITQGLVYDVIEDREDAIPEAYASTFKWIFDTSAEATEPQTSPSLVKWLSTNSKDIYWVNMSQQLHERSVLIALTDYWKTGMWKINNDEIHSESQSTPGSSSNVGNGPRAPNLWVLFLECWHESSEVPRGPNEDHSS